MRTPEENSREEVIRYAVGADGFRDVATYDAVRYQSPASRYKQRVMAQAYHRLLGPLAGKHILDVGCGTGRGLNEFALQACSATGVDASRDMLAAARCGSPDPGRARLVSAVAQRLPFPDASFDIVTSLNFLHLFSTETQRAMVAEMKRVVRPGGTLVLEFDNALNGLLIGPYKRWRGEEHGSLPREIRRALGGGCRVEAVHGAVFPVVWRLFHRAPRLFAGLERAAFYFPLNRLAHRIYFKLAVPGAEGAREWT